MGGFPLWGDHDMIIATFQMISSIVVSVKKGLLCCLLSEALCFAGICLTVNYTERTVFFDHSDMVTQT